MSSEAPKDVDMTDKTPEQPQQSEPTTDQNEEPKFGGFTRFEVELEFVQCLFVTIILAILAYSLNSI